MRGRRGFGCTSGGKGGRREGQGKETQPSEGEERTQERGVAGWEALIGGRRRGGNGELEDGGVEGAELRGGEGGPAPRPL